MRADPIARQPWRLLPNRVPRFYTGGALLEAFRGEPEARADTDRPEDWVGSATRAWTRPGAPADDLGLGLAEVGGVRRRVVDLLAADPEGVVGPGMAARAPGSIGVLVKLLDAAIRLPVHAHPSRGFARRHLGSFFGKTEAWIVLATRPVAGEPPPHIRLGFRRDVEPGELRRWIDDQRTGEILAALHERPVEPGDTWLVPAGAPHAIGAGVFILELQEPSDFSIVLETAGYPIDAADAHLHLGWDTTLEAIDGHGLDEAQLEALRGPGPADRPPSDDAAWQTTPLLPAEAGPFFRADRLTIHGPGHPLPEAAFVIGLVTGGAGLARIAGGGDLALRRGTTFASPAATTPDLELIPTDGPLEIIVCRPPAPDRLEAEA